MRFLVFALLTLHVTFDVNRFCTFVWDCGVWLRMLVPQFTCAAMVDVTP